MAELLRRLARDVLRRHGGGETVREWTTSETGRKKGKEEIEGHVRETMWGERERAHRFDLPTG